MLLGFASAFRFIGIAIVFGPVGERLQVFAAPEGRGDLEHLVGVENLLRMPDQREADDLLHRGIAVLTGDLRQAPAAVAIATPKRTADRCSSGCHRAMLNSSLPLPAMAISDARLEKYSCQFPLSRILARFSGR